MMKFVSLFTFVIVAASISSAQAQSFSFSASQNPSSGILEVSATLHDDVMLSGQQLTLGLGWSPSSGNLIVLVAADHKYKDMSVTEILKKKKASIKDAPLPAGSPSWDDIKDDKWEDIEKKAKANETGYKTIKKLLTDKRFDK